jgi:hypothetical protein
MKSRISLLGGSAAKKYRPAVAARCREAAVRGRSAPTRTDRSRVLAGLPRGYG